MENEINQTENIEVAQAGGFATRHNLNRVTAVSKYLALTLFILLPFLGGYIGYVYAPEKVVEVEKIVERETESNNNLVSSDQYSLIPEVSTIPIDEFINLNDLLKLAPFSWNKSDVYPEFFLTNYLVEPLDAETGEGVYQQGCYVNECKGVTLVGDIYSRRFLNEEEDYSTLLNFDVSNIGDYLETQGYVFLVEVGKGFQFGEGYQKNIGDSVQVINIYEKPINFSLPENDSYPSSDGTEIRVYVSQPFINPL